MVKIPADLDPAKGLKHQGKTWDDILEERSAEREAAQERAEKLAILAKAYAEGLEAGGKEEAERRMEAKFDEINPPKPDSEAD